MNEFRVLGMRLKKDGTPDKRQFRYKWHGYEEKPNRQSTRPSRQKWVAEHKEELRIRNKEWRTENRPSLNKKKVQYLTDIREQVITAFGGKCQCCGETDHRFLTLDHINGRVDTGKSSNGRRIMGKKAMLEVVRLGFPKDKFQILCFNCNCAKGIYGICPHQEKGISEARV